MADGGEYLKHRSVTNFKQRVERPYQFLKFLVEDRIPTLATELGIKVETILTDRDLIDRLLSNGVMLLENKITRGHVLTMGDVNTQAENILSEIRDERLRIKRDREAIKIIASGRNPIHDYCPTN